MVFLQTWSEKIMLLLGYPGIFLVMFLECVFPPIPSEVIMPLAGFLVVQGRFNVFWVMVSGTLGSLAGALLLYWLGAWADEAILRRWVRKYGKWLQITELDIDRVMKWFDRFGQPVIFFGRMVPLVRSLISIPAGLNHMKMGRFLIFTISGSVIWNLLLTYGGILLGENWEVILAWLDTYETIVLVTLGILFVAFVVWYVRFYIRRKKERALLETSEAGQLPEEPEA
jgi:membrane protein DedA with SNARE-associated domain